MAVKSNRPRFNGIINRVKLVGIELEGGWDKVPPGEDIVKDGSVKFQPTASGRTLTPDEELLVRAGLAHRIPGMVPAYKGEIVSKPLAVDQVEKWIKKAYPQHVNETCGLHIHMSFYYRANYSRLMVPEFTPWMIEAVREWATREQLPKDHPQWHRLDPLHHWTLQHCAHVYLGEEQVKMARKDFDSRGKPYSRYTFINYCDGQHRPKPGQPGTGTVEVRGFSMPPTAEQAARAVFAVVDATNRFLSKLKQREHAVKAVVTARPEPEMHYGSFVHY